jgi:DNA-binding MarR family transcriptional regulator
MNQNAVNCELKLAEVIYHLVLLKKWRDGHCLGETRLLDDEVDMLGVVEICPGITISNLAKYIGISLTTAIEKLEKLIRLSYVTQEGEGRKLPIHLTESGKQTLLQAKLRYLHQVILGSHLEGKSATTELHDLLGEIDNKVTEKLLEPFNPVY